MNFKSYPILIIIAFLVATAALRAQSLTGKVASGGEALAYATIAVPGSTIGTVTDENGAFELLGLEAQTYELSITSIGYRTKTLKVDLSNSSAIDLGAIELLEDILGLEEVVVTGTMKETFVAASPIKVDVITAKFLQKNISPTNIVEGITLVNGVQEVVACGVCFTNSISINGLPGAYTAVLMDGTPIYGNLASVYGLNGIPTMIIDRFEVIKGPSSTLYGSEAVAGVINIITKDPAEQPALSVDLMATSHLESFGNLAFSPEVGDWNAYVGLNYAYINNFDDENNDFFSDVVNMDRISLFTKWSKERADYKTTSIAAKYYYEDRRNGVEQFLTNRAYRDLRGNEDIYGESIYTNRLEIFGTHEFAGEEDIKLDFSLSHHDQDSYYGSDYYQAQQQIAFTNLTWNKEIKKHDVLVGLTARYQYYDDNTIATDSEVGNAADHQLIPGVFVQDEWTVSDKFTLLTGARLDHYENHGLIFAPRLSSKYKPSTWSTLRMNFGTGFRLVNLFTEDHAFISGQRAVEIVEELRPEQSYNASLNWNQIYNIGNSQGSFDIDAFYTYFTNKILPDYETPGKIIYANTDGYAITRGIGMTVNHQFMFPLAINMSWNVQEVIETEPDENGNNVTRAVEFAPDWTTNMTLNYNWRKPKLNLSYTFNATGPMALPELFDLDANGNPLSTPRPTESEAFLFHNVQITKGFSNSTFELYLGVQNLFDYRQEISPVVGVNDPTTTPGFSQYFDTSYAFSPIHGREFYLGFRWNTGRRKKG